MTVLSDGTIRKLLKDGTLIVEPKPWDHQIQPVSIDLTLDPALRPVVGSDSSIFKRYYSKAKAPYVLLPSECVIASTVERIQLPDFLVARVEGKSTLGRLFITVHHTAGLLDPGFDGQITLEIKNNGPSAFRLEPDMSICQVVFEMTDCPVERPYGSLGLNSHYQGQQGATLPHSAHAEK